MRHVLPMRYLLDLELGDVEQFNEAVRDWDLDFRQPRPGPFDGHIVQVSCSAGHFSDARVGAGVSQQGIAPGAGRTFAIPVGPRRIEWYGRTVGPGDLLVFNRSGELQAASGPDFHVFTLTIPEAVLDAALARAGWALPSVLASGDETVLRLGTGVSALRGELEAIRRLVDSLPAGEALAAGEARIAGRLPALLLEALSDPAAGPSRPPGWLRARALRRALDHIHAHPPERLSVTDLCDAAAACERTLDYAFKEHLDVGPAAYVKAHRLTGARRALERAAPGGSRVTEVAARWGFTHLGQFATDYRRRFGELPSATLKRR